MAIYLGNLELATGGGATGTGLPVNTYASFLVSATDNPTGYNATTGLYTHPNGDYWLKTGYQLASGASYPDATISASSVTYTGTSISPAFGGIAGDMAWDGTYFWSTTNNSAIARSFDKNGTAGPTINAGTQGLSRINGIGYNGTNIFLTFTSTVYEYTTAGTYTGNSYTAPTAYGDMRLTWDGSFWYTMGDGGILQKRNPDFSINTAIATIGGSFRSLVYVNGAFWAATAGSTTVTQYDMTGTATGITFSTLSQTNNGIYGMAYDGSTVWTSGNANISSNAFEYTGFNNIGDSTARTDADTSQPLFVKIK